MNNREARETIENLCTVDEVSIVETDIEALRMSIKALEQTEWIPVTERLPEENGMYLVTRKANYPQKCRGKMYQAVTYAYYNTLFKTWNTNGYPNVVAWRPLPEPYKGDTE